jgi:NAD(P)-dependent dehydrogenase (short-subunit alcohol dehydrogenase family)
MTEQRPIGSGFGAATTTAEVIEDHNLSGKSVIVTGGYSGLGLVAAAAMAEAGAEVIVPARDPARAAEAMKPYPDLKLETLDLMDPASIDAFADRFLANGKPLHILMNNAGVMAAPLARDSRGYERQISTNHLGHFQLTCRLWPALRKASGARVISLSSSAHTYAPLDLDDINWERREYERWRAYSESKTANVLFAVEADARGKADGIRAFSVHPGGIITNLGRHSSLQEMQAAGMVDEKGQPIIDPESGRKNPEQGAATQVWCAVSPQLNGQGGVYCEDCEIADGISDDAPAGRGARAWATNRDSAARLWTLSEQMTGARLN